MATLVAPPKYVPPSLPEVQARAQLQASDLKTVNYACPVCGELVDPKIAPVIAEITGINPNKIMAIGTCSDACAKRVAVWPAKYAAAASNNRITRLDTEITGPNQK